MSSNYEKDIAFSGTKGNGELILVRGVPGSGKSTYCEEMTDRGYHPLVYVEADMYFSQDGEYKFIQDKLFGAHRWCLTTAKVMLNTRNNVMVSNTFTKFGEARDYIDFAKTNLITVTVVTMRQEYGSIHDVPLDQMQRMRDRFESHETFCKKIHAYRPQ